MSSASISTQTDSAVKTFCTALTEMYGERLKRVVLFGSRARGDAQPDADYDIAIFLTGIGDASERWAELERLALLRVRFIDETGIFFDAKAYPEQAYREKSPLMHEIRRDGLDL